MLMLSGCTRNNGDIGKWFGNWQVEQITANGEPWQNTADGQYFWEFQNNIIKIVCVAPNFYDHEAYYCIGTWQQTSDNTITLDFSHTDDNNIYHKPFWIMQFPTDKPFTLTITQDSGKKCVMKRIDESSGVEFCYYLIKR